MLSTIHAAIYFMPTSITHADLCRVVGDVVDEVAGSAENEDDEEVDDEADGVELALLATVLQPRLPLLQKLLLVHVTLEHVPQHTACNSALPTPTNGSRELSCYSGKHDNS